MTPPAADPDDRLAGLLADTDPGSSVPAAETAVDPARLSRARKWVECLTAARPAPPPEEDLVLALVAQEIHLRRQLGRPIDLGDYLAEFPELADRIRRLADPPVPGLPARYRVVRAVGAGGMGRVYEAFDDQLHRRVAVKVSSAPRPALLASLAREATVLAALQHPHIVGVHDSGTLPGGEPFFVMQFVDGEPFDRYARGRPPADRVRLVAEIAAAVGAAHRLGVVHRDLKPGNVLVTPDGRPMVLDFGLAKRVTDPALRSDGGPSAVGVTGVVGTAEYMAPEQAAGQPVDARADVYALGVILAGLLPPRPPADLAAVADKCRADDPAARYPDAAAVADDLTAWLRGRPVAAVPGRLYRVRKFVRRNWVAVAVAAVGVGAVAAGVTADAVRVRRERDRTEAKRIEAVRNYQRATAAVQAYLSEVTEDPELRDEGRHELRGRLLEKARVFYEEFVAETGDDPELRAEQADALARLGGIAAQLGDKDGALGLATRAVAAFEDLVRDHPDRADWRLGLASARYDVGFLIKEGGRFDEADRWYLLARDALAGQDGVEALRLLTQIYAGLGWSRQATVRSADAAGYYEIELETLRRLVAATGAAGDRHLTARCLLRLGTMRLALGARDAARDHLAEGLGIMQAVTREHPKVTKYTFTLGGLHERTAQALFAEDRYADAEAHMTTAVGLFDRLARDYPAVANYRRYAANNRMMHGRALAAGKRYADAEPLLTRSKEAFDALSAAYPQVLRWERDRATAAFHLALLYQDTGRADRARALLEASVATLEKVEAIEPRYAKVRKGLISGWSVLATLRAAAGDEAGAAAARQKAAAVKARTVADKEKPPPDDDP